MGTVAMKETDGGLDLELIARLQMRDFGIAPTDSPEIVGQKLSAGFLPYVDPRELHRRISRFRKLRFQSMSYSDVRQAIGDVITFDTPSGPHSDLQPTTATYATGTRFYRARTIPQDDHRLPLRSMSKTADCWEPPPELVTMGRLNKAGESLLYSSPIDLFIAAGELKVPDRERFSLIEYEAVEDVNVAMIGGDVDTGGLDEADALKVEMIQGFLRDEFTRDVGQGTEFLYRISEVIAKDYFDLPPQMQDVWCYPSIVDQSKVNVAFRPEKRGKLRLIGVVIGKICRMEDGNPALGIDVVAAEAEGSDDLSYFRIGSPVQRQLFPWIREQFEERI